MTGEGRTLTSAEMAEYLAELCDRYPIMSIEDGMAEDDFEGWKLLTDRIGSKVQLVGDDLFVTNPARLRDGIGRGLANSLLVKFHPIGTLSAPLEADETAPRAGDKRRDARRGEE